MFKINNVERISIYKLALQNTNLNKAPFNPRKKINKSTCKPGSVVDSHSSRANIATCLKQSTRVQRGPRHTNSYLILLRVGFT